MKLLFGESEYSDVLISLLQAARMNQAVLIYGEASTGKVSAAKYMSGLLKDEHKFYLFASNAKISKIEPLINDPNNILCFSDFEQWQLSAIDYICHNVFRMKAKVIITISEPNIERIRIFFEKYDIVPEMFSLMYVPSLRERKDELVWLAKDVIEETAKRYNLKSKTISRDAKNFIVAYPWYGNFHEFNTILVKGFFDSEGDAITEKDLGRLVKVSPESADRAIEDFEGYLKEILRDFRYADLSSNQKLYSTILEEADKVFIDFALQQTMSSKKACQYLGISSNTFRKKYLKYYNDK
jgi:DNA-binding NtrC family response regulator